MAYTWIDNVVNPAMVEFDDKKTNVDKLDSYVNPSAEDIDGNGKVDWKDAKTIIKFVLMRTMMIVRTVAYTVPAITKGRGHVTGIWRHPPFYSLGRWGPALESSGCPFAQKYSDFKTTWKNRATTIYVGANDGMLHSVNDGDGKEKFSIIPKNLLGKLKELAKTHEFFVDSSPRLMMLSLEGLEDGLGKWGERGGNYYFCVDITDPSSPQVLWNGQTQQGDWDSPGRGPEIGWVRLNGQEKFVALSVGDIPRRIMLEIPFMWSHIETGTKLRGFDVGDKSQ